MHCSVRPMYQVCAAKAERSEVQGSYPLLSNVASTVCWAARAIATSRLLGARVEERYELLLGVIVAVESRGTLLKASKRAG